MESIDKPGAFYIGKYFNQKTRKVDDKPLMYESKDLTTHAVCLGMTGSGKTGLGMVLLEEAALDGIPALIIDPKGDLTNLMLAFPELRSSDFLPWVDSDEAERNSETIEKYAEDVAKSWKENLSKWGQTPERIQAYKDAVDTTIYTPASEMGKPLSILSTFPAPSAELVADADAFRNSILSTTSGLLGLLGLDADPISSREHILIATIFEENWRAGKNLDLPSLIQQIQKPDFDKVGVFDLDTFYPPKDRLTLAMRFNNLLASPGFKAWTVGEPLNIQNLLYTKEGKPRHSILSIAHLADSERMFFVTLLLNALISWMRNQSGTSSLRAMLYMDEIYGYFPPTAQPPSKLPMITLLKQARAFGVGVVLTTQNPVDLDYKGLSNCGTWFLGKLQTARDKARVLEGLKMLAKPEDNSDTIGQMIDACGNRVFIMRSVYMPAPILFQTRSLLSYLRGPLTLPQIQKLTGGSKSAPKASPAAAPVSSTTNGKPLTPTDVAEFYVGNRSGEYHPELLGIAKLHFVDAKNKIDTWQSFSLSYPVDDDGKTILWDQGEQLSEAPSKSKPAQGSYEALPSVLMQSKNYKEFEKTFATNLYQNFTLDFMQAPALKLTSQDGESEAAFKERIASALKEKRAADEQKVRDQYAAKIATLNEKIQRAQDKLEVKKTQSMQQKFATAISVGATILGSLFGRGITKGSINQAGTSIKNAGRISKTSQDVTMSEESLGSLQQQLTALQAQMNSDIAHLDSTMDPDRVEIIKTPLHPRKGDIAVETIAILWKS